MIPIIVLGVRLWQIILRRRGSADGKNMVKSWENPRNPLWMDGNHWENHWLVVKHGWENSWSKWRFLVKSTDYERLSSHVWWAQIKLRHVFRVHMAPASTKFWSVKLSSPSPNSQKCWAVREGFFGGGFPSHTNYIDEPLQVIFDSQYDAGIIHLPISNGGPEHFFLIQIIGGL